VRKLFGVLFTLLVGVGLVHGQATLTSTTLSAAVTSVTQTTFSVTSATGFVARSGSVVQSVAVIDQEKFNVVSVSGTRITVERMAGRATLHASGATVYVGPNDYFNRAEPVAGTPCTSTAEVVLPVVIYLKGAVYNCTASVWTPIQQGSATGTGNYVMQVSPSITTSLLATTAGATTLGSATKPFSVLDFAGTSGTPGTNNFSITGASTSGTRTITFPDASISVPGTRAYNGGTTSTYTPTNISPTTIIHSGSAALVSTGSTSPVTIATFSPAFTSATSYVCTASPVGTSAAIAAGGVAITQSSATQIILYGPASVSTVVNYVCLGN
jgi:hypothetical protein